MACKYFVIFRDGFKKNGKRGCACKNQSFSERKTSLINGILGKTNLDSIFFYVYQTILVTDIRNLPESTEFLWHLSETICFYKKRRLVSTFPENRIL